MTFWVATSANNDRNCSGSYARLRNPPPKSSSRCCFSLVSATPSRTQSRMQPAIPSNYSRSHVR